MNHVFQKKGFKKPRWCAFFSSSSFQAISLDKAAVLELDQDPGTAAKDGGGSVRALAEALRQCGEHRDLSAGKRVHTRILSSGLDRDRFLGNLLVAMYGKCGSVDEAWDVFEKIPDRNVFSWNIMISAFAQNGQLEEAVALFRRMLLEGEHPNGVTLTAVLHACSLDQGEAIHTLLGSELSTSIGTSLLDMYGRCGELDRAAQVFEAIGSKDVIAWNALISACAHNDDGARATSLFRAMLLDGFKPNQVTFLSLVDACQALDDGELLHALVLEAGYRHHLAIANCLVDMYSKCGSVEAARDAFDSMENRDVVSWNTMIAAHARADDGDHHQDAAFDLFQRMLALEGPDPDRITYLSVIEACQSLQRGRMIHTLLLESRLFSAKDDVVLHTVLLNMYARCSRMDEARAVFDAVARKDLVCWNSLLAAYAHNGLAAEALRTLREMDLDGSRANRVSFMSAIEACSCAADASQGSKLHQRMAATGFGLDVIAGSALVAMYGKCHSPALARSIFDAMPEKNVISWTALIGALAENDLGAAAAELFRRMDHEGVKPNAVTLVSAIDACSSAMDLGGGSLLHRRAADSGVDSILVVSNSLINMYGKCQRPEESVSVFNRFLGHRDVVSWNALLSALARNGLERRAIETYRLMLREGIKPDRITFVSVIDACASLGSLPEARSIHSQAREGGFDRVDAVLGTLVSAYGRCGSARDAQIAFDGLARRDAIAWNAAVTAIARSGDGRRALALLRGMDHEGVKPDAVTFITLLDACADHTALAEGKRYHARAVESGFALDVVLGNALLNMYGKCGSLIEAARVFAGMGDRRNSVSWNTMIVALAQNGRVDHTIELFRGMDLEGIVPNEVSFLSILFACSHAGMLDEGRRYFQYMIGDHGVTPAEEHYGCFVDLLGRTGRLAEAEELVKTLPSDARPVDWMILLGSSALQDNAQQAARAAANIDSNEAGPYLNLLAAAARSTVDEGSELSTSSCHNRMMGSLIH